MAKMGMFFGFKWKIKRHYDKMMLSAIYVCITIQGEMKMNFLFTSIILPGILWDCIKAGSKVSSKILFEKLQKWSLGEEYIKILQNVLQELINKDISSKKELKKELKENKQFKKITNKKIIINGNVHKNIYINIFGVQNIVGRNKNIIKKNRVKHTGKAGNSKNRRILFVTVAILGIFVYIATTGNTNKSKNESKNSIEYWNGRVSASSNYGGGTGTAEDPYLINSASELAQLSYFVEHGIDYRNTYFKLNNDLYLNEVDYEESVQLPNNADTVPVANLNKWIPIGSEEHPFRGCFNGNNKTIQGLYIEDNNKSYQGLFGYCTSESKIENLTILNSTVDVVDGNFIGGICGKMDGLLNGCFSVRGWVCGGYCVGGIVGEGNVIVNCSSAAYIMDTTNMWKSYDEVTVDLEILSSKGCIGGIAGKCNYLINSVSYSRIMSPTYRAGVLAGEIVFDVYNCVCKGGYVYFELFEKYFTVLQENNMEFLYGGVIGVFWGKGNKLIDNHCVYNTESASIYVSSSISDVNRSLFESQYLGVSIELIKNQNMIPEPSVIGCSDYSLVDQKYNSITEKIDYNNYKDAIKTFNNNISVESDWLFRTDIYDVLMQYGTGGGVLNLRRWIHSDEQNIPILEGMTEKYLIYKDRSNRGSLDTDNIRE